MTKPKELKELLNKIEKFSKVWGKGHMRLCQLIANIVRLSYGEDDIFYITDEELSRGMDAMLAQKGGKIVMPERDKR